MSFSRIGSPLAATLFIILIFCKTRIVQSCHAGYSHGSEEDEEEGLIEDYEDESNSSAWFVTRRKRQIEEVENFSILRAYFKDCMLDKVGYIWDWKSVVDFSIQETIWFLYSATVACSEQKNDDTVSCWQECIEVYLREDSALVIPAKQCVALYSKDFEKRNPKYTSETTKESEVPRLKNNTEYEKCITIASISQHQPLYDENGNIIKTSASQFGRDINSIILFIQRDVKCSICDYGFLPGTQQKPSFVINFSNNNTVFSDGNVEYTATWPFVFEALTRRDSNLRPSSSFCNGEFAPTFTRDPPPKLGWAEWVSWGKCFADCAQFGIRQRIRVCIDTTETSCSGRSIQQERCINTNCAYWAEWGDWTPCHSTCGLSVQMSFRLCKNGIFGEDACQGDFKRVRSCVVKSCEVPWSQWSRCSVTCGENGVQSRDGGDSLLKLRKQNRVCSATPCPDVWSTWSPWGSCSVSCGGFGVRKRFRDCLSAHTCKDSSEQVSQCDYVACDDSWSNWGQWTDCNWKKRTRVCIGGTKCEGNVEKYQRCDERTTVLSGWSQWSMWTECSPVCGDGLSFRRRTCISPISGSCTGHLEESLRCYNKPCHSLRNVRCVDDMNWGYLCQRKSFSCNSGSARRWCKRKCGYC